MYRQAGFALGDVRVILKLSVLHGKRSHCPHVTKSLVCNPCSFSHL